MKNNLEIEYKTLLTEAQYLLLKESLVIDQEITQKNTYYDNPKQQIRKAANMCRVRAINNQYEFTLKIPEEAGVREYSTFSHSPNILQDKFQDILIAHGFSHVSLPITTTLTQRSLSHDTYAQICLDRTTFEDGSCDFELEYELYQADDKAFDAYLQLLDAFKIPYKKAPAKFARALNRLK